VYDIHLCLYATTQTALNIQNTVWTIHFILCSAPDADPMSLRHNSVTVRYNAAVVILTLDLSLVSNEHLISTDQTQLEHAPELRHSQGVLELTDRVYIHLRTLMSLSASNMHHCFAW
jgi:hypothetical protein